MERAEFMHLLRLSEQASAEDATAYRRGVGLFAALGYAWVLGCLLAAVGILGAIGWHLMTGGAFRGYFVWTGMAAAGLLLVAVRALWVRLDAPQGEVLQRQDAPALFDLIERVRAKVKGPTIDRVLLDGDLNASIVQLPRFGLLGGSVNYLVVGLPLLMALDTRRLGAVLAHEYGHLRGGHGRFAAWVYRSRLSWARLHDGLSADPGPAGWATNFFLNWYVPRFSARTFALARQDEYEADRVAGKIAGNPAMAAALVEMAVKADWLDEHFWPGHSRSAARSATPIGPYAMLRRTLAQPVDAAFARQALRNALKALPAVDDTHPGLRDRLEALGAPPALPEAWSEKSAISLLADRRQWIERFDRQWCRDNATGWKRQHAYYNRVEQRLQALRAHSASASAAQWCQMGELLLRLDPEGNRAQALASFERALTLSPDLARALRGCVVNLPEAAPQRLERLTQLFEAGVEYRHWAALQVVAQLEAQVAAGTAELALLKTWRERQKTAEQGEQQAWEDLTESPFAAGATAHDLDEFELGELRADLAGIEGVHTAWLVRKNLRSNPSRRAYLMVVSLADADDGARHALCRYIERAVDLPGPVIVLWREQADALEEVVNRIARTPAYTRRG